MTLNEVMGMLEGATKITYSRTQDIGGCADGVLSVEYIRMCDGNIVIEADPVNIDIPEANIDHIIVDENDIYIFYTNNTQIGLTPMPD